MPNASAPGPSQDDSRPGNSRKKGFLHHHSLGITAIAIFLLWVVLYCFSNPNTHMGSFFGNAIADWSGVVLMVYATKYLYERGSTQSRRPPHTPLPPPLQWMRDHSLTMFLAVTWVIWIVAFARMDAQSRWGQVVGNIVSEWTQALGLVVLTKHMIEEHSRP
jgi:hypothetical protein